MQMTGGMDTAVLIGTAKGCKKHPKLQAPA